MLNFYLEIDYFVLLICDQYSIEVRSEGPNKNKQLFALTQIF